MNFSGIVNVHVDSKGISRFARAVFIGDEDGYDDIDFEKLLEDHIATDILDVFGRPMVWARYKRHIPTRGIYQVYFTGETIIANVGNAEYLTAKLDKILYTKKPGATDEEFAE